MTLTTPILALVDHDEAGALTAPSAQVLTAARSLTSGPVVALALDTPDTDALARYGAARVLVADLGGRSPRLSAVVADAAQAAMQAVGAEALLCVSHYLGREVAARLAVALGGAPIVDVTRAWEENGNIHASKPALAGAWETSIHVEDAPAILAIRPSAIEETEAPADANVEALTVDFSAAADAVTVVSSTPQERTGRMPLTEARTVIVGGRGLEGDFSPAEELADLLDAAVGATRVATDEGWVSRSLQVGQTGVSISPNLYIGLGVSGAIHHTVGMQSSRHIVAVCDDPDAPIFEIADFGVVGDLFEVVPQAIEVLRREGYGQA
ncbi:electron transfer flavoprotein subunit alpha/FixB family protein [Schaalia canis]|uniref:Electron transfer flavoprotein subunit alpha/FixB family protein n=1 Tax=Schaalia canis TaxID=100469 RepID=A0A3P1SEX5_9ACTO|nr:electron transfer flavoprotein subunit alpha/FixB family protein [Schaalia canis]RRC94862.1 electron transfer flavoprotein subunit alpha/FixB family protein [Schaalia canis]